MMTETEMRIAITENCGWKKLNKPIRIKLGFLGYGNAYWLSPNLQPCEDCHNYPQDLNACHEMEKVLNDDQWHEYICNLERVCNPKHVGIRTRVIVHEKATQRSEAFCRVFWPKRFEK